jgi:hypothetical protein
LPGGGARTRLCVALAGFGIAAEAALAALPLIGLCMIVVGLLTGCHITRAVAAEGGRLAIGADP